MKEKADFLLLGSILVTKISLSILKYVKHRFCHIYCNASFNFHTSSMRYRSCIKLSLENARKVPPIVTESGITLNAPPPWNFATVTTCKGIKQIYRIVAIRMYFTDTMSGLHENNV